MREQTYPRWQAIVCDDASSDDSLAVLAGWSDPRIRAITHAENRGYIAVLKRLIEAAETDLVAILDSDDALMPEATARVLATAAAHPHSGLIWSRFRFCDADLKPTRNTGGYPARPGRTTLESGAISHLKVFRRATCARIDGFDEGLLYAEDRDLVYQLEEVTEPVFIDAVLYRHRVLDHLQSHDQEKHEIGLRRGIEGGQARLYRYFFALDYASQTMRLPGAVKMPLRLLQKESTPWSAYETVGGCGKPAESVRRACLKTSVDEFFVVKTDDGGGETGPRHDPQLELAAQSGLRPGVACQ